ncbi:hypothetical protein EVAR_49649_1 [Eumeta japonica]|uniref:Uncharacterized protein n=1 Tax=Eumeta variegata TaxID=151549 RepID=A0A4C1YAX1_EUMVA|nr:hypothetical protein EVAR_49649_1 [Eumeta japonica]
MIYCAGITLPDPSFFNPAFLLTPLHRFRDELHSGKVSVSHVLPTTAARRPQLLVEDSGTDEFVVRAARHHNAQAVPRLLLTGDLTETRSLYKPCQKWKAVPVLEAVMLKRSSIQGKSFSSTRPRLTSANLLTQVRLVIGRWCGSYRITTDPVASPPSSAATFLGAEKD